MEKHTDIDALAARMRPLVGDNGVLHPHTLDRLRPLLAGHPGPMALLVPGEVGVRLLNGPMTELTGVSPDAPATVPMHLICPVNLMAYTAMRHHYGSGTEAPFAHLVCMGSGAAPTALLLQVRYVGRALAQPVLLSTLTLLVPAMNIGAQEATASGRLMACLTQREREVLRLLASDRGNEQVCHLLHISADTLATHKRHILNKLGARSAMGLLGILTPGLAE